MARAKGTPQVSALERLGELPALFTGSELTRRFQWTSRTASQYLYLWKQRGLVEALGGHSDVFANLLADRRPDWGRALRMAMPSAITIGVEALRQAGWTTQIPTRPEVAVARTQRVFVVDRFDVQPRGARWFEAIRRPGAVLRAPGGELPRLTPAWALADSLRDAQWGDFGLAPDDIDWDAARPADRAAWGQAVEALRFDAARLAELTGP